MRARYALPALAAAAALLLTGCVDNSTPSPGGNNGGRHLRRHRHG